MSPIYCQCGHIESVHEELNPAGLCAADIVVGLPSFNEAGHITAPVRRIDEGLRSFFPDRSAVIVNCDNHSPDGTREAFMAVETDTPKIYISSPPDIKGLGINRYNLFRKAAELSARAVAIFDANLTTIQGRWVENLISPILNGVAGYVAPFYVHHRLDAPITNALANPLLRFLFGRRVRQPISVDMAFSGQMNGIYHGLQTWPVADRGYDLDMRMLTLAIINQAPICQSFVATPRAAASNSSLDNDLGESAHNVLKAILTLMMEYQATWTKVLRSRPTAVYGVNQTPTHLPAPINYDEGFLLEEFKRRGREMQKMWPEVFRPEQVELFQALLAAPPESCELDIDAWRRAVLRKALAFREADSDEARDRVCRALGPLFFLKTLTFHRLTRTMTDQRTEALVEEDAQAFEELRKGFIAEWLAG